MSSPTHSSRRPIPALVFLLALAVLAVVVWVRVADRNSSANESSPKNCASAPQLPANAAVTVTVLNANGADGLATRVLDTFAAAGFKRGNVGDTAVAANVATVTSGPNNTVGALLVSYYVPGSTVTTDNRGDASVTITVGKKFTALYTSQQAKAAMAKAMVSQSAPAPAPGAKSSTAKSPTPTATCFTTPPVPSPAHS